jgi:hypothetical protein
MVFGPQSSNRSLGRSPDGSGDFIQLAVPSPGRANVSTGIAAEQALPVRLQLLQNWPNPFNAATTIAYQVVREGEVRIAIYDAAGRQVRILEQRRRTPGSYQMHFDAADLPSGIYICRIATTAGEARLKMALVR